MNVEHHSRVVPGPHREPDRGGLVDDVRALIGFGVGMFAQAVNELTSRVHLPGLGLPSGPVGEVIEPPGDDARAGASLIQGIVRSIAGTEQQSSPDAMRLARPLLAEATVTAPHGSVQHLAFEAAAPGTTWSDAARASSPVAVYVDGRYHSTVLVTREHPERYDVNLGLVSAGPHHVELRAALDRAPSHAPIARVHDVRLTPAEGFGAIVDGYAPVLELRDLVGADGALDAAAGNDAPLAVFPLVTQLPEGGVQIDYHVVFSGEDGGTVAPALMSQYGTTLDIEPVYRVRLDGDGRLVRAEYQTGVHQWREFDGERLGSRALLRVSSSNNMTSARVTPGGAERWSDGASSVSVVRGGVDLLGQLPWLQAYADQELLREGRVRDAAPSREQVHAPQRYVSLGPLDPAERAAIVAAGGVRLALREGGHVVASASDDFAGGEYGVGAVLLPPGYTRDDVLVTTARRA